jgi:flagellar hook protein FlgE
MFQQGLSGLNAASKSLDVIGNNVANASTVGFKSSEAQFADLYASSLNGVAGNTPGIGVTVARLAQQFTQGNIETTNNPLDISINGDGFFRMNVDGAVQYTRNGQFLLDKTGTIINAQGAALTGYLANKDGVILQGAPVPLTIDMSDLPPVETTEANFQINLSSNSTLPAKSPFDASDPTTYNKQTVMQVFDSLGNAHTMGMYYVSRGSGTWDVYAANDGVQVNSQAVMSSAAANATVSGARGTYLDEIAEGPTGDVAGSRTTYVNALRDNILGQFDTLGNVPQSVRDAVTNLATSLAANNSATPTSIDAAFAAAVNVPAQRLGQLVFNTSGVLDTTASMTLPVTINLPIFPDNGAELTMEVSTTFNGTTQYGSPTSERNSTQNGYAAQSLVRFATDANGVIMGQYSEGASRALGQVVLADFASVDNLTPLGNNMWAESSGSGQPRLGTASEGGFGQLRAASVESSNVDLTEQLVDMITAQRVYQANAQTIKTEDSILQTLVNLR